MKVLFFYQHFWPDSPPYANMLRVIGDGLSKATHDVSVITSQPSYKESDRSSSSLPSEQLDGIQVRRLALLPGASRFKVIRLLGKAIFPVRACLSTLITSFANEKPDVVIAATIPPVVNGLMAYITAKLTGARFVYHFQDIYPEIGAVGGLWSPNSLRHKVLKYLDSVVCRKADVCITLSSDMANSLVSRGVSESRITVINNFMLADFNADKPGAPVQAEEPVIQSGVGKYKLVFAGNLGRFQGLEELLQAFLQFEDKQNELELHFIGDGVIANKLKQLSDNSERVFFYGHQTFDDTCSLLKQCDAGIVSIQPEIYQYAYPSKTMTYLGLGLPVLAFIEEQSSMAVEIATSNLGVSADNSGMLEIQNGFVKLREFLDSDLNDRAKIKLFFSENMATDVALDKWSAMISKIQSDNKVGDN